ncbi:MAG: hypothetical protein M5R36_25190 [Deltaproteobacteria bacterium]|nr:hypothetical protein [Deltaproteobacteria bacterium]
MKRLKFVLVTCVVMGIVTAAFAGWEELESLPDARYGGVLVSDGTYLYYFGGSKDFFNDARDDVYRYNPATDTWDTRADMPQGVIYPSGGIVGNSVYLSGGYYYPYTHTNDTQIFDISGNTWSAGYDFPFVGYGAGAAVIGNDIYHLGGYDYGTFYNLDDVNIYDTVGIRGPPATRWRKSAGPRPPSVTVPTFTPWAATTPASRRSRSRPSGRPPWTERGPTGTWRICPFPSPRRDMRDGMIRSATIGISFCSEDVRRALR